MTLLEPQLAQRSLQPDRGAFCKDVCPATAQSTLAQGRSHDRSCSQGLLFQNHLDNPGFVLRNFPQGWAFGAAIKLPLTMPTTHIRASSLKTQFLGLFSSFLPVCILGHSSNGSCVQVAATYVANLDCISTSWLLYGYLESEIVNSASLSLHFKQNKKKKILQPQSICVNSQFITIQIILLPCAFPNENLNWCRLILSGEISPT